MDEVGLSNSCVFIKEEITDETDSTCGLINVKQEEEMVIPYDGQACENRWKNIGDSFRESHQRNKTKIFQSSKKIKMQKFTDQLNSLKKHYNKRGTKGNFEYEKDSTEKEDTNMEDSAEEIESASENIQSPPPSINIGENVTRKIKKKKVMDQTAAAALMRYLINQKEKEDSSSVLKEQEPIDAFLISLAPALKTLSPYQWHFAKSELFAIVQKFEAAALKELQAHQRTSPLSSSPT